MPIYTPQEYLENLNSGSSELDLTGLHPSEAPREPMGEEVEDPGIIAETGAMFRRHSEWKGIYDFVTGQDPYRELGSTERYAKLQEAKTYNAYDKLSDDLKPYASEAFWVSNDEELALFEEKARNELKDDEIIAAGGLSTLFAGLLVGGTDPSTLLPGGVIYKTGKGATVLANALKTGGMAAGIAAADEALLHQTQVTRSVEDSLFAVGGAALLGGALGAGIGSRLKVKSKNGGEYDLSIDHVSEQMNNLYHPDNRLSLSAAKVVPDFTDMEYQVKGMEGTVSKQMTGWAPVLQASKNGNPELIKLVQSVVGDALARGGSKRGLTNIHGFDELLQVDKGRMVELQVQEERLFTQYQKREGANVLDRAINRRKKSSGVKGTLTLKEFNQEVGKAFATGEKSSIPEANEMAKMYREKLYDPFVERLVRLGRITPEEAASPYMNRKWNKQAILDNETGFIKRVAVPQARQWVVEHLEELRTRLARGEYSSIVEEQLIRESISELNIRQSDPEYLKAIAQDLTDFMVGRKVHEDAFDNILMSPNRFGVSEIDWLKGRVINIENRDVLDFIETDMSVVAGAYFHQMSRKLALEEWVQRQGEDSVGSVFKRLSDSFQQEIDLAANNKIQRELIKKREDAVKLLKDVLKRELGIYRTASKEWKEITGLLKAASVSIHLPNTMLVSIGDPGRVISETSVKTFTKTLAKLPPLVPRSWNKSKKLTSEIAREYLGLAENLNNRRVMQLADLAQDDLDEVSWVLRRTHDLINLFSKLSGMGKWNQYWKEVSIVAVEHDLVKAMRRVASGKARTAGWLAKDDIEELSRWGIDLGDIPQMLKEIDRVVGDGGEIFGYSGFNRWQDPILREKYSASLVRIANNVIVTPTGASLPRIMSTTAGSMIGQFKSFAFSAHSQILVPMKANPRDMNRWMGFGFSALLGTQIVDLKSLAETGELSDISWEQKALHGIDYSGAFSLLFMTNTEIERSSGMRYGLKPWLVDDVKPWGAYSQGSAISLFGPVAGDASKLYDAGQTAFRGGDLSEARERQLYGLIPFWRWAGARWLTKQVEDSLVDK